MAASLLNVSGNNVAVEHDRSNNNNNNNDGVNNNNNYNNNNSSSSSISGDNKLSTSTTTLTNSLNTSEMKEKRKTLEQRKQHLEKLLLEKKWVLQQLQKEEMHILQGNYEYVNLNDIFANLAQQYKLEQQQQQQLSTIGFQLANNNNNNSNYNNNNNSNNNNLSNSNNTAILRRKSTTSTTTIITGTPTGSIKENNNQLPQNVNNKNRQSEISNRSSEYDNYPCNHNLECEEEKNLKLVTIATTPILTNKQSQAQQQHTQINKKRATPTSHLNNSTGILNYPHSPRQPTLQRQTVDRHRAQQQYMQQRPLHPQQQQQQHQRQQQIQLQHVTSSHAADAISLYSINSSNVATLRHQHIAPQQQPIVVQYEKYCLSPTRQTYSDGCFIKGSQEIKRFISSPQQQPQQTTTMSPAQQQHLKSKPGTQILAYQQLAPIAHYQTLDAISLAPSYMSVNSNTINDIGTHNLDTNESAPQAAAAMNWQAQCNKIFSIGLNGGPITDGNAAHMMTSNKHLDDISICSMSSEKKSAKPKVWLESSLDGPLVRATCAQNATSEELTGMPTPNYSAKLADHKKLSSQSMSTGSGRHYSMSAALKTGVLEGKSLQEKDVGKLRLSQSSCYLNELENVRTTTLPNYKQYDAAEQHLFYQYPASISNRHLPPKTVQRSITPTPPPRPMLVDKFEGRASTPPAPQHQDIRIESPKNMTIITQATFQPYKEVTKPFEMSDFYKYSTKFRQKDSAADNSSIL